MALNVCAHCTTKFAVGLPHCPQCGNADYYEEGSMAKISRHAGPTTIQDITGYVVPADVELVEVELSVEDVVPVTQYDGLLRSDLQDLCRDRGLPTSGNKDELVARLIAADEAPAEAVEVADEEAGEESDPA